MGYMEGLSFLLLVFIAMPVKYALHEPLLVRFFGSAHGGLFVGYCGLAAVLYLREKWPWQRLALAWILSCLPFGTIWFDRKYMRATEEV